ncbi:MAG: histidinol-phosphatase [Bacteroidales bacterium]
MKTNYHTHTKRCKHAFGEDEEYVKSAIKGGYSILGFADHTPWPYLKKNSSSIRMETNQLPEYVSSIIFLKERFENQIDIKIGLECEFIERYTTWLSEVKEQYKLDYLLFGNHYPFGERGPLYTSKDHRLYTHRAIKAMQTGIYDCIAHPEILYRGSEISSVDKEYFRELSRAAKYLNIIMEYNTCYKFKRDLWEIVAQEDCKVIIGLDAHKPETLEDDSIYTMALANMKSVGIVPITNLK